MTLRLDLSPSNLACTSSLHIKFLQIKRLSGQPPVVQCPPPTKIEKGGEKEGKKKEREREKGKNNTFVSVLATVTLVRRAGDSPNKCTTSFTSTRSYTGAAAAAPASPCCCAASFHDAGHAAPAAAPSSDVNSTKSTADEVTRETFSASEFLVWSCGRWWWCGGGGGCGGGRGAADIVSVCVRAFVRA